MQYRKMEKLGWDVSALGFGCMRLPTKGLLKRVDEEEAIRIIRKGIDLGINYIDTAWPYHMGNSEKVLGKALQDGYREKVKLVTKLPMFVVRKEEDFDRFLNAQLKKLQTTHIDLYLFHGMNKMFFGTLKKLNLIEKMEKAKNEGKIKGIGFSFHDSLPIFKEIIDYYPWDACQIQYNYMDTGQQAGDEGLTYAHEKGISVIIMEPIKGGMLANPPSEALELMKKSPIQRTPVDWALQFVWNKPEVSVVLSGMGNMQMVEENCASAAKCPYGVNIPGCFAAVNTVSINDSNKGLDLGLRLLQRIRYRKMAKNKAHLVKKPNNGRASMCTNCEACIPKCPQHIQIPDELVKVVQVMEKRKSVKKTFQQ
ncbi:MAG: aldo/keto reductase [Promethearchaeota archaeon]